MDDEISERLRSVNVTRNEEYVEQLKDELNLWKTKTRALIDDVVAEKQTEIDQHYRQYCQNMKQEYERIDEEKRNIRSSSDINDQIKTFNQAISVEQRLRLRTRACTREQFTDKIHVEYDQIRVRSSERRRPKDLTPDRERREQSPIQSPVRKPTSEASTPIRGRSPPRGLPIRRQSPEKVTSPIHNRTPRTPKPQTRLYVGRRDIFVPVLIGKDREVFNETEQITEYSIDSIPIPQSGRNERGQSFNLNPEDDITLVGEYKDLVNNEDNRYRVSSGSVSDADDEETSGTAFSLRQFDTKNYSTIMFRKCETEYNCIASSTRRNEVIVYNSRLKILIILQHESHQQFRHRFFVQWPNTYSPRISDITYCEGNDQYIISTRDDNHLYMFNRDLLSLTDLGQLERNKELFRIHCYGRTLYCISGHAYLDQYQFDERYSSIKHVSRVGHDSPADGLRDETDKLLDVTCDQKYLAILYANIRGAVYLEQRDRKTGRFVQALHVENSHPIDQLSVRLEVRSPGNFLYLNGGQKHLKSIDFIKYPQGKVTSVMRGGTKPTNTCFLPDGRLVILYEHRHFLAFHPLKH